jgi:hypothetical protein
MNSSTASTTNGVYLPNFPLATGDLLRAIEHSGSVKQTSSDDAGEYYSMAMAKTEPAEQVMESAIIVIPLTVPRAGEVLDFTFVAAADCMYFQLHQIPQLWCGTITKLITITFFSNLLMNTSYFFRFLLVAIE